MANKNRTGTAIRNFMLYYEETILIERIDRKLGTVEKETSKKSLKLSETVRVRRNDKKYKQHK